MSFGLLTNALIVRRELLPEFDRKGRGLGRGAGREPSVWLDGKLVVERAACVADLIRTYRRIDEAYLPLWLRGYAVPLKRVGKALRQPVSDINQAIQKEMKRKDGLVFEEVIDDALYEASRKFEKHSPPGFQVSLDKMSAAYNILFNPEYEPEDGAFEEFQSCEGASGEHAIPLDEDPMAGLFQYADFIKEHLSFERMKEALRHCTDEDLRVVERDLGIVREIVFHVGRMVQAMFSAAAAELTESFSGRWQALFTVGRLFVLADLSLRRSGFGDWIDAVLLDVLHRVQAECTESKEAELRAASAQFVEASQAAAEKIAAGVDGTRHAEADARGPVRQGHHPGNDNVTTWLCCHLLVPRRNGGGYIIRLPSTGQRALGGNVNLTPGAG